MSHQPATSRHLVTLRQAVEQRPWLTERWLRRLVFERRVPFHRVGSRLLFDLDDLDTLAEQGRGEPARHLTLPHGPWWPGPGPDEQSKASARNWRKR